MKFSVIIPVYNEESTIEHVIEKVNSVRLPGTVTEEIVIVNDGSTDRTRSILDKYSASPIIKVFHFETNQGKTAALAKGIECASGDVIIIQDADLEYNPDDYAKLLEPILQGRTDVVYGSRFKGSIKGMTLVNRLSNIFSNITFNLLYATRLSDINTCYKVFKKDVIKGIKIVSTNFTFETEITAKLVRRGVRILEVPINYEARSHHQGKKIRWDTAIQMYWGMIKYRRGND